jgi:hypothetical protein
MKTTPKHNLLAATLVCALAFTAAVPRAALSAEVLAKADDPLPS